VTARVRLEVCVDTPAGLAAALAGGADRIELCAALDLGGLTPAPGLMAQAAASGCETLAMIRPRAGDFVYEPRDLDAMRRDIDAARAAGLTGVVLGASRPDGALDAAALAALVAHAAGLELALHRAFDVVPELSEALEAAIALGFARILTSGGRPTAAEGGEAIASLVAQARGRIAIMAGAGLTPANVADVARRTGVSEVHASCRAPTLEPRTGAVAELGFAASGRRDTSRSVVEAMRRALLS
jgi:copper homeostasis protein